MDLSAFEIAHFFTLESVDIRALRSRYKDNLRLGAVRAPEHKVATGRPMVFHCILSV
ncbi:MAG: hypothetical protein ACLQFF_04195 [Steroidobacteraceae bacterium]